MPKKLRNAVNGLSRSMGHGKEYKYPHDFEGNYVVETYLPDELLGEKYYRPTDSGHEAEIKRRLEEWEGKRKR